MGETTFLVVLFAYLLLLFLLSPLTKRTSTPAVLTIMQDVISLSFYDLSDDLTRVSCLPFPMRLLVLLRNHAELFSMQ